MNKEKLNITIETAFDDLLAAALKEKVKKDKTEAQKIIKAQKTVITKLKKENQAMHVKLRKMYHEYSRLTAILYRIKEFFYIPHIIEDLKDAKILTYTGNITPAFPKKVIAEIEANGIYKTKPKTNKTKSKAKAKKKKP